MRVFSPEWQITGREQIVAHPLMPRWSTLNKQKGQKGCCDCCEQFKGYQPSPTSHKSTYIHIISQEYNIIFIHIRNIEFEKSRMYT